MTIIIHSKTYKNMTIIIHLTFENWPRILNSMNLMNGGEYDNHNTYTHRGTHLNIRKYIRV